MKMKATNYQGVWDEEKRERKKDGVNYTLAFDAVL